MSINEYFAEKCGVKINPNETPAKDYQSEYRFLHDGHGYNYEWNYKDPRCREIIRERFKISTNWSVEKWFSTAYPFEAHGNTIPEAEIACIESIYNSEGID